MSDLVERLRKNAGWRNQQWQCVTDPSLLIEAADKIAAMQADAAPVVDHPPTSNPVDDSETGNTSDKPDTTPAAHDITQADREAAAKAAVLVEMRDLIRAGRADHHAEPWAQHRLAERAAVATWLRDNAWRLEDASTLAASIEAGEHLK